MRSSGTLDRELLDAWREQGADLVAPIAFQYMAALQRRAAGQDGDARHVLESKLSELIGVYAGNLERAAFTATGTHRATTSAAPARGALGDLADDIARRAETRSAATDDTAPGFAFPELGALDDFRKIWASVRSDSQVRRSLERSPTNAGPLNSSSLVHRSLTLMRELSPDYLQKFLSYVDALSWMEQINALGVFATSDDAQPRSRTPRARNKPRKPRE